MWKPIHIEHILNKYKPFDFRVLGGMFIWISLIFLSIWLSLYYLPSDWVSVQGDRNALLQFFLINPSLLLGLVILFWFGFEWAFIPVFLSMFIIGFFSHLPFYWSIVFGLSFVFGLTIYAIVYHCLNIRYDLRSLMSLIVFVITSFIAATASSLGSFIWSLAHDLSAVETATLWNGWWAGSFLQELVVVGPLLFLFSKPIEKYKERWFDIEDKKEVSTRWVYSAVILTTIVIAIFIFSGDYLAKLKLSETLKNIDLASKDMIMSSLDSFEIITWVSIWIIICVGLGGIFLIGSWNKELQRKVDVRTRKLKEAEEELQHSLSEKVVLLQEIHHRVKNNLAVVIALLDLQYMRSQDENIRHILSDSKARIKSMAFVHETLYQTENFSKIELKPYLERLCQSIITTFKSKSKNIDLSFNIDEMNLEMNKAVPLGLILNELIINAYKHAFNGRDNGEVEIKMTENGESVKLEVIDNGIGIEDTKAIFKKRSLGMTLIKTLANQLKADMHIDSVPGNTNFNLIFNKEEIL